MDGMDESEILGLCVLVLCFSLYIFLLGHNFSIFVSNYLEQLLCEKGEIRKLVSLEESNLYYHLTFVEFFSMLGEQPL